MNEGAVREALAGRLGREPGALRTRPLGGGCIGDARVLECDAGRFFVKSSDRALPGQFAAEAEGLRALRRAAAILVVPEPLVWSDEDGARFLVTEYLEPGPRRPDFDETLGRGLAEIHACAADEGFGFPVEGYCGATPQPNGWMGGWVEFWAERRLGHQLRLARDRGLAAGTAGRLERLIGRLDEWIDEPGRSSLIHGDLWSGNLHVAPDGRPALIDPAAYYGHPEAELGMMALFGGFSPAVWKSYAEAARLEPGWRNRLDLYTLYHVLNHFVLFGGGYGAQADELLRNRVG